MPVPSAAEPISRVPTRETVAATLRAWIVDCTLTPEEVLRDAEIAHAFGISRTPVREALLQLEHEGLVESHPGRWTRVTPLDPQQLGHMYPVWVTLEALAARLAATEPPGISREALQQAADHYAATLNAPPDEVRAADTLFHDEVLALARNPQLDATLIPLRLALLRFDCAAPTPVTTDRQSVDQHASILNAITNASPNNASDAAASHAHHTYIRLCDAWSVDASAMKR